MVVTGHYTERVAAAVVKTIVEVVQLCHKLGTELNHKPARLVSVDVLKKYLEERIFPKLGKKKFTVLYVHIGVQRSENFAGISSLRSIYDAIPANVKENLEAFYFIHPGLQARLFLATFGRFLFNAGLYGKLSHFSSLTTIASNFDNVPHYTSDSNSYDSDFRDDFDTKGPDQECGYEYRYLINNEVWRAVVADI
ncbi:hypothetical protein P8452_70692 [Trifolium repens]|nr:hypothetical protein P8452_53025 [Trifolium repens]WJX88624.1 hypothetical protein P8452_70692 [Trifolium repens]